MPTLSAVVYGGTSIGAMDVNADYSSHFSDGMNTHAAYRQNPIFQSDPLGLYSTGEWWEDTVEGASTAWHGFETVSSFGDIHGLVQGMAEELTEQYAANLEGDVNWALDWSAPDDGHTRLDSRWVNVALVRGALKHFGMDYWQNFDADGEESGPAMAGVFAGAGKAIRAVGNGSKLISRFFRRFKTIPMAFGNARFTLDSKAMRHILERHHPRVWDGSIRATQTFFDHRMDFDEVVDAIKDVAKQNRTALEKIGHRRGQVVGNYGGRVYKLGVDNGRIGQFYPLH